jgi:hypothetical protein
MEAAIKEKYSIEILSSLNGTLVKELKENLQKNADSHFYHYPGWLEILSEETAQPLHLIVCRNSEGIIEGLLPLLSTKGIPFGPVDVLSSKRFASLPRTPFAGPLYNSKAVCALLLETAKKMAKENPDRLIQIKSLQPLNDTDNEFKSIEWRKTYVIPVPGRDNKFAFSEHTQRDVNRCKKQAKENNIEFKTADSLSDLKKWYMLYLERMRFHRVPARSFSFFKNCRQKLSSDGMMELTLAVKNTGSKYEILAGNINFIYKDYCYGGFGAAKSHLPLGDFLMYNELLTLQQRNIRFYDLGEVPSGHTGLEKYKKKWGAEQIQIYHNYFGKEAAKVKSNIDFLHESSLSTKIWRLMPLHFTARIGGLINKRL